jgi:hypothetical protein
MIWTELCTLEIPVLKPNPQCDDRDGALGSFAEVMRVGPS